MKAEKKKHLSPEKRKMKQKTKSAKHPKPQMTPVEDEPVLKKQKLNVRKQEEEDTEEELSPEEKRILERKLKKERKKAQKKLMREVTPGAEKNQPKKPSGSELALDYLTTWSGSPQGWKFQKTRQTWLLLHMYDKDQVPDQYFSILLRYLEGLQGRARDTTVQKAEALMKEYDQSDMEDNLLEGKCGRIRKVLQLLS
uniref:WKF domain-containing protein n=1 Tax=Micrurus lemniscatus lemniscatus TaxID=129467 RepID=A0A2D4HU73_MICLE